MRSVLDESPLAVPLVGGKFIDSFSKVPLLWQQHSVIKTSKYFKFVTAVEPVNFSEF